MAGLQKILLVEDDMMIRDMYRLFLESKGYTVATAVDGDDGLVQAKAFQPELIFLDIMMPKKSGLEVLAILRKDPSYGCQKTRIVILTNLGDDKIAEGIQGQIDGYAVKAEITLSDLIDIINSFTPGVGHVQHAR